MAAPSVSWTWGIGGFQKVGGGRLGQIAASVGGAALVDQAIACGCGGQGQIAGRGVRAALGTARDMQQAVCGQMRGKLAGKVAGRPKGLRAGRGARSEEG